MTNSTQGSRFGDRAYLGSGSQTVDGGAGRDHLISLGDSGEQIYDPITGTYSFTTPDANDVLIGGSGGDTFEFRALINATPAVRAQHTNSDGNTNWARVAGENDNWHDHWVEGFGDDTVMDFSKAEGDKIVVRGHTATIKDVTYGEDAGGTYSLITVYSQQGDGGAGGANTATGAHDEDPLGTIKVYGDKVELADIKVVNSNDGIDQLERADAIWANADLGMTQEVFSNTDGTSYTGLVFKQKDVVHLGEGSQTVNTNGGNDKIYLYSDGGEPDPAQTEGAAGRINDPVPSALSDDVVSGGQGRDVFAFRLLLNATDEVLAEHTRANGTVNWRKVAGENDNVHDHWVEGIGDDTILDFSKQDGDKIDIRGHTVEIAEIVYGEDEGGDYSLIVLRSQQGDGGGAHDEDLLGTIKVYGDQVTEADITVKAKVFYGIDMLDDIDAGEDEAPADNIAPVVEELQWLAENPQDINITFTGFGRKSEIFKAGSGVQTIEAGEGRDRLISYGDAGEPDPAQTEGGEGRVNPPVPEGAANDILIGGAGADRFEFHALLNARREVIEQHTNDRGDINWRGVAGENDNVHDHWVEGIGDDTILDFSKAEGDKIIVRGHTMTVRDEIVYGEDEGGSYSIISLYSQQGDGGAGGANTATGAHDEDSLGTIKVYGDKVELADITVQAANVFDGVDRLPGVDALATYNGGSQYMLSNTDGDVIASADPTTKTKDEIWLGMGSQTVDTGLGRDKIRILSDGCEPDPAQTEGSTGRVNPPIPAAQSTDIVSGGQGRDEFIFNFLLNARHEVLARHTRDDGSVNWRGVAGENGGVHDHWVESGGDDVLLDFSKQDGDKIVLRGHTVELAGLEYGEDEGGDFTIISIRSQQGDGGGAHDEDSLGTIKVYGDKVTEADIKVQARGVFDGIDKTGVDDWTPNMVVGTNASDTDLSGTEGVDLIKGNRGADIMNGNGGDDFLIGGGHNDQMFGGDGNDFLDGGWGNDTAFGGDGEDIFYVNGGRDLLYGGDDADHFIFDGKLRGATIADYEDGVDCIDMSRLDKVGGIEDLTIQQLSTNAATITFTNDAGRATTVEVYSSDPLTLTQDDFLF